MKHPLRTSIPIISRVLCYSCITLRQAAEFSYTTSSWREVVEHYNLKLLRTIPTMNCNDRNALWCAVRIATVRNMPWLVVALCRVFDHLHTFNKSLFSRQSDAVGPLVVACILGHVEIVEFLLTGLKDGLFDGDLINNRDILGETPLLGACRSLLPEKKDNNEGDAKNFLHAPSSSVKDSSETHNNKIRKIIRLLLQHGASIETNVKEPTQCPFFSSAIINTNEGVEMLRFLLVEAKSAIFHCDASRVQQTQMTCLMCAVQANAEKSVKFLLEELPTIDAAMHKAPQMANQGDEKYRTVFDYIYRHGYDTTFHKHRVSSYCPAFASIQQNNIRDEKTEILAAKEIAELLIKSYRQQVGDDLPIFVEGPPRWRVLCGSNQTKKVEGGRDSIINNPSKISLSPTAPVIWTLFCGKNIVDHFITSTCELLQSILNAVHHRHLFDLNFKGFTPLHECLDRAIKDHAKLFHSSDSEHLEQMDFKNKSPEKRVAQFMNAVVVDDKKDEKHQNFTNLKMYLERMSTSLVAEHLEDASSLFQLPTITDIHTYRFFHRSARINDDCYCLMNQHRRLILKNDKYQFSSKTSAVIRTMQSAPPLAFQGGCNFFHLILGIDAMSPTIDSKLIEILLSSLFKDMTTGNHRSLALNLLEQRSSLFGQTPLHVLFSFSSMFDEFSELVFQMRLKEISADRASSSFSQLITESEREHLMKQKELDDELLCESILVRSALHLKIAEKFLDFIKNTIRPSREELKRLLAMEQAPRSDVYVDPTVSSDLLEQFEISYKSTKNSRDTPLHSFARTVSLTSLTNAWSRVFLSSRKEERMFIESLRKNMFEKICECFGKDLVMEVCTEVKNGEGETVKEMLGKVGFGDFLEKEK